MMIKKEIWKKAIGLEDYFEVSTNGNIKCLEREYYIGKARRIVKGKVLSPKPNKLGYIIVQKSINGVSKLYKVHRLIALTFIPNPQNKPFINHINGNPSDNRVENLEWCTQRENILHSIRITKTNISHFCNTNFNKETKSRSIRCPTLDLNFPSIREAARQLGMSDTSIGDVCKGKQPHNYGLVFNYINI